MLKLMVTIPVTVMLTVTVIRWWNDTAVMLYDNQLMMMIDDEGE